MKTVIVECKFVIEIPWEHTEPEYSNEDHIRFCIEENGCPGTGSVGHEIDQLVKAADKNSICWACVIGGENKILAIEDRVPRKYVDEITFKESKVSDKCPNCGSKVSKTVQKNAGIVMERYRCRKCKAASHSTKYEITEANPRREG